MERRLAAILAADVVGYSRLMGAQEEATLSRLEELHGIVGTRVSAGKGRIFSLAGDGILYQRHQFLTRGGFPFCDGCDSRLAKEIRHVSMHCASG